MNKTTNPLIKTVFITLLTLSLATNIVLAYTPNTNEYDTVYLQELYYNNLINDIQEIEKHDNNIIHANFESFDGEVLTLISSDGNLYNFNYYLDAEDIEDYKRYDYIFEFDSKGNELFYCVVDSQFRVVIEEFIN